MATRFYPNAEQEPADSFSFDGAWDESAFTIRRRMYPYRNSFEIAQVVGFDAVTTNDLDVLLAQFVSPPLQAQTITGTFAGAFMVRESNAAANMRSQVVVRVIAPDGTVRGTLISASAAALSNEWIASTTSYRCARFPVGSSGTSVSSVSASAGDRIVVEVGCRAINTSGTTFTGTLRYGGGITNTDLPSNDTQTTGTTDNPWMEFSQNLTFLADTDTLEDDVASAPDLLPAPLSTTNARSTNFDTFTDDANDPQEMLDWNGIVSPSGWVKLANSSGAPALLEMRWTAGYAVYPSFFVYDDVPDNASVMDPFPFSYDEDQPYLINVPDGETWYVGVIPGFDAASGTWLDTDIQLIFDRLDSGPATGDIKDNIADAVDRFPSAVTTEVDSETTNLSTFTSEADDPTEVWDYTDSTPGYTGWLKLVVPVDALVTISVIEPTGPQDLMFWLYDEVPTASSIAIAFSDDDDPTGDHNTWPYLPELSLEAGTYYLLVNPYEGADWDPFEGGQVTVRVRWEQSPIIEDFSADAVIKRAWAPPNEPIMPTLVGSTTATVDNASALTIPLPSGLQDNDLLIVAMSWDRENNTSILGSVVVDENGNYDTITLMNQGVGTSSADHRLAIYGMRYQSGGGDVTLETFFSTGAGGGPAATAKAGAIIAWRNASEAELLAFRTDGTYGSGIHFTQTVNLLSNAENYDLMAQHMAIWAGGNTDSGRWDYSGSGEFGLSANEVFDATATSLANIVGIEWVERRNFIDQQYVIPRNTFDNSFRNEIDLNGLFWIHGTGTQFGISAILAPGFGINAYIQTATHTTHPRTGPHTGTHPSTAIVTSALLGSLPAGTDLNTVIADLDDRLTDLENQA